MSYSKVLIKVLAVFCLVSFIGCTSMGNKRVADKNVIKQIKEGKSSNEDVIRLLGTKGRLILFEGNQEVWKYSYTYHQSNPAKFIPCIGLFVADTGDSESYGITIKFDKDGIVRNVTTMGHSNL